MQPDEKISLRPLLLMATEVEGKRFILAQDQTRQSEPTLLPAELEPILRMLDGNNTARDIQLYLTRASGGTLVALDEINAIIDELDERLLLDSPRFRETQAMEKRFWDQRRLRKPFHAGQAYPNDPQELAAMLDGFYDDNDGPGKDKKTEEPGTTLGVLTPHIDVQSGGTTFAWAYNALKSRQDAELYVILGTAHDYTSGPISISRKDFLTPLGILETDNKFIDLFLKEYSPEWITDDFAHRNEHSVEFQTIFLKHIIGADESKKIVPILVGSFEEAIDKKTSPSKDENIARFVEAFLKTVREYGRKVVYIVGGDLAHIGPRYGHSTPVTQFDVDDCKKKDVEMLDAAAKGAEELFDYIANERDARNVCGFPPLYIMLKLVEANKGKIIHHAHWFDEATQSAVTFAAMTFGNL